MNEIVKEKKGEQFFELIKGEPVEINKKAQKFW